MLNCLFYTTIFSFFVWITALPLQNELMEPKSNTSNINGQGEQKQGWMSSPQGRGTFDILWSSIFTWILCGWTMLSLNIPAPDSTALTTFRHKALTFLVITVGPEFIGVTVMGQYLSARQSVRDFAAAGISDWTLQRAYFSDMGGFILQTCDWVPFPVNAKQLLWLIQRGYISVPPNNSNWIKDKNKLDGITRVLMVLQLLWFIANFFARIAKGFAITGIELNTMALIYFTLPIMFLWRHKPADVKTAEVLTTEASMAEILLAGGEAAQEPYSQTPLDFVSRKEWAWSLYWSHFKHACHRLHLVRMHQSRPIDRFSNVSTAEVPIWIFRVWLVVTLGYTAIFMVKWNSSFPTDTEQFLWRTSCIMCIVSLFAAEIFTDWVFYCWPHIRKKWGFEKKNEPAENSTTFSVHHTRHELPITSVAVHHQAAKRLRRQPHTIWDWFRNPTLAQDPHQALPLKVVLCIIFLSLAFLVGRFYILVEDFMELRSLPSSSYETIDWGQLIPHFG